MRAVVQRVTEGEVTVEKKITGAIGKGLVVLLGVEDTDTEKDAVYLAEKIAGLSRIYIFLIAGPMAYGAAIYLLAFFRNKQKDYGMLFEGFSHFGKAFWLMLLMGIKIFLWSLLFVIPGIIASIRYSMAFYVLIDHPEYRANECIEASKLLMLGNKGRYFYLQLTFFGWYLLASIPGGIFDYLSDGFINILVMFVTSIPVFFVDAYLNMSNTVFYELSRDNLVIVEKSSY